MNTTQTPEGAKQNGGIARTRSGGSYTPREPRNTTLIVGLALVALGLLALCGGAVRVPILQPFLFPLIGPASHVWDLLFLPALGGVFLAWGIVVRRTGLLIPGGVLAGVGLGVMLNEGPLSFARSNVRGGAILVSMGLGWAFVAVLALVFIDRRVWWPFILAAVLSAFGVALMAGDGAGLSMASAVAMPLALIGAGIIIVLRRGGRPRG